MKPLQKEQKLGLSKYVLCLADNNLIISHRLSELCAHAPTLEEDIAVTNIALDLLGHARLFYDYAGKLTDQTPDDLVYFRDECEFYNMCLTELPNLDYAHTMLRLYWYSIINNLLLEELTKSEDENLSDIANKIILEVSNHISHSQRWITIFAQGTTESQERLKTAIKYLSPYLMSCFESSSFDKNLIDQQIIVSLEALKPKFISKAKQVFDSLSINLPDFDEVSIPVAGSHGYHTEHLGYILATMQHLSQQHKGANW